MKKGILGFKQDPKKKMLLFVNGESWPSDDSEDETYIPDKVESAVNEPQSRTPQPPSQRILSSIPIKKMKTSLKKQVQFSSGQSTSSGESKNTLKLKKSEPCKTDRPTSTPGSWGTAIPPEILVKIFKLVISMDGAVRFLHKAAKVCMHWNRVSYEPSLWEVVDLSSNKLKDEEKFIWLCKNRLRHLKELNLSEWGNSLTHRGIKAVSEHCPRLTNINLSGCRKLNAADVRLLADSCLNLSMIDLSYTANRSSADNPVSNSTLKYLMNKCGKNIAYFSMANNTLSGIPMIVTTICEHCPNLEALDISNVRTTTHDLFALNIERLQEGCPKLRVLRLANTAMRLANVPLSDQVSSPGFPRLKELSIAATGHGYTSPVEDAGLDRIVKSSEELELLDVRGCKRITTSSLVRIPAWHLRHLFLSQCSAAMDPQLELVMQKWRHSLIEVDLSWNNHITKSVDVAVNALTCDPETSKLQILDLCGSSVSFDSVKNVLNKCSYLRKLNLSSCRGLPRGMKRLYVNDDLDKLKQDIESAKFVQYEEVT